MRYLIIAVATALASTAALADQYVNGYYRQDGTYVAPHYQTSPNQYRYDNYSSQGNVNPYTGQRGNQRNEYSNPPAYNQNYGNPNYGQSNQRRNGYGW